MEHLTINGQKIIRYKKAEGIVKSSQELFDGNKSKMGLSDGEPPNENIWIAKIDNNRAMLLNHALAFYPFPTWGAIVPLNGNIKSIKESYLIELHQDAWDKYFEEGVINEEGYHIEMIKSNENEEE